MIVEQRLSDRDRARLAKGVLIADQLLGHVAFSSLIEDVSIGDSPAGVIHPTSTCPMGAGGRRRRALVAGTENVHVVDASVFPDLPTTNTYLPTLMLAERLAARLGPL